MSTKIKTFILFIIVGIGLLVALAMPRLSSPVSGSKKAQAHAEALSLAIATKNYIEELGKLPTTENATVIRILMGSNSSSRVYFNLGNSRLDQAHQILDPEGKPYSFEVNEKNVIIHSPSFGISESSEIH